MRFLLSITTALTIIGATPAAAGPLALGRVAEPTEAIVKIAQGCSCIGGYVTHGHTVCTAYECRDLPMFAPNPLQQVRSARDCPRSRVLVCDFGSCKLACDSNKK